MGNFYTDTIQKDSRFNSAKKIDDPDLLEPKTRSLVNAIIADAAAEAVTKNFGKGRIVFIPDSYAFSNSTLRTTDNAVWMVSRATEWNDAETKNVFIDEYHHGFGERRAFLPLIGTFLISPWGFMTMQLALAGLVFMLGTRRRFGRPGGAQNENNQRAYC